MKDVKKDKKEILKQQEILDIINRAKQKKNTRIELNLEKGEVSEYDELEKLLDKNFDNPDEKFDLFYNGIQSVINKNIPVGIVRDFINDEKLIFLNMGKARNKKGIRGSDCRMQRNATVLEVAKIVSKWALESLDPSDLYLTFYNLNEEHGYPHQEYDGTSKSLHKEILKNIQP